LVYTLAGGAQEGGRPVIGPPSVHRDSESWNGIPAGWTDKGDSEGRQQGIAGSEVNVCFLARPKSSMPTGCGLLRLGNPAAHRRGRRLLIPTGGASGSNRLVSV